MTAARPSTTGNLSSLGFIMLIILVFSMQSCSSSNKTIIIRSSSLPAVEKPPPAPDNPAADVAAELAEPSPSPGMSGEYEYSPESAGWMEELTGETTAEPPIEPNVEDDYTELVGPFDEMIIDEMTVDTREDKPAEDVAVTAEEAAPIEEEAEAVSYDFPIEFNSQVLGYIELFKTVRREGFERGLKRSRIYEKMMKETLAQEGLPTDLYYLCLIESSYNPKAYSKARAMGPWQFIESTGRLYDLHRTWWIDERRDPEKSTMAAARHLKDLFGELESWPLALAAYNAGLGRVRRAIARSGSRDFWTLRLPSQTRNYVPAFMAATIIAKCPEKYGFQDVEYEPPLEYEKVAVDECTDLDVISECAGISTAEIKSLNPELRRWCTPPSVKNYMVSVPPGTSGRFIENYAMVPGDKRINWRRYKIAPGDTLSVIARRFGTDMSAIAEVNNLKNYSFIRAGKYLLIPLPAGKGAIDTAAARKAASYVTTERSGSSAGTKLSYRVRPGDNLWYIAQRHGVTVQELRKWNPNVKSDLIHSGDIMTVWSRRADIPSTTARRSGSGEHFKYQVKKGDTLWDIARRFERPVEEICRANGIEKSKVIYPGETITIPGSKDL